MEQTNQTRLKNHCHKMDTRQSYRDIIKRVISPYAERRYFGEDIVNETVFDQENDRYIIASAGWQGYRRVQQNQLHISGTYRITR